MAPGAGSDGKLRWRLADDEGPGGQGALFDGDQLVERHVGTGEFRGMEFLHVNARSIINEVPAASRMPFRYTINAYRGCSHACTYCFARPTHEYLGLGVGQDFERKIVVKINAVERLRAELAGRRWAGHHIAMGTNTDPYQRCEGKYHLTRGVVEVLGQAANPFSILTKSTLILRDLPLLAAAAQRTNVRASLSIGTLDPEIWRLTEPGTPHPQRRVEAVRRLNDAGVPCGVLIAPILPGLSDSDDQLAAVVTACVDAGAVSISSVGLHLRPGVREHFLGQLAQTHPELAADYERRYRGAYLPKSEQQALSERVRLLVDRARGGARLPADPTGHSRFNGRPGSRPGRGSGSVVHPAVAPPSPPGDDQLAFELPANS
jgi:DNA repair photolyase